MPCACISHLCPFDAGASGPDGGDANWRPLCRALTGGYSQVEATVDSYLENKQFFITPDVPPSPFRAHGQEVILVSFSRGIVKSTPGFDEIKRLKSFVYLETGVRPGSHVDHTVDLFSGIGSVILLHEDKKIVEQDVKRIRQMETDNLLFEYESSNVLFKRSPSNVNLNQSTVTSSADRPDLY